ncbi:MAG: endonuclease III [Candidatus Promineifilaceae bacterium]|nr:endonuclease III [Candidatus Promineifilaceae bacterium]
MGKQEQERQDKYETIYRLLLEQYGQPEWRPHLPPVDELVSTILSQNTNDTNRDRAFERLQKRFSDWEAVLAAPEDEIVEAIRPAGLANQKAPRIHGALEQILEERGEISLDFLAEMPLNEAREWLTDIKGVGPKTAAIVLLFAFNRPVFPVDTHVHRVSRRLGLIADSLSAEKAHQALADLAEPDHYYSLHLNLIRHGREICTARKPKCERCFLSAHCRYYRENRTGDA